MSRYAAQTTVSVANSRAEIERLVERYGAAQFISGWEGARAIIGFTMAERQVRFVLTLPDKQSRLFTHSSRGARTADAAIKEWEQACRQRWRALALVVKAKLEAVEAGISTFENEFMANVVMPDGRTVADHAAPMIAIAYETGTMTSNLLPDYSSVAK